MPSPTPPAAAEPNAGNRRLRVVVTGGGTAGWLAAAALGKLLGKVIDVTLIESQAIGRVGVGEATIPPLRVFHRLLGIDEAAMMRDIQATVKLGIEFSNWGRLGDRYIHSFGVNGQDCWACEFAHFWLAGHKKGLIDEPIGNYCRELVAAQEGRALAGEKTDVNYAYHFDAGRYADFLKRLAIDRGVSFIEGIFTDVIIDESDGSIHSLRMADGSEVTGDLFLDCTGFAARLIHGALNTSFEDWGHFLPCNGALAVQSELAGAPRPYTQAIAHGFGWQWRIPLQHRMGNGLVYSTRHVSDDEAQATLLANLESPPITEPKAFKYRTGRRISAWNKNCVAIGLAAGFLEPVESTSIHLAMAGILRLLKLLPQGTISAANVAEYNRQTREEFERVRNFIILHYHATERGDTAFWRYCRAMDIPAALAHRIALFRETGAIPLAEKELFRVDSWTQVMLGQHIVPRSHHPIVDAMDTRELERFLTGLKARVREQVARMPTHQQFLDSYCRSKP